MTARGRDRCQRCFRPIDAQGFATSRQHQRGGVKFVRSIRITWSLWAPRVVDRAGDFQRLLDFVVIAHHLAPFDRPVRAIAKLGARLEPLGTKPQRHHGEMHGRAADRFAGIVGAELNRIVAVDDALVRPVQLALLIFIRGKILQRPPVRPGVKGHDREPIFRKLACERAAARASTDNCEVHDIIVAVLTHRHPSAGMEDIRRSPIGGARRFSRISRHAHFPTRPRFAPGARFGCFPRIAPVEYIRT